MISLPDAIVIYPQKKNVPGYLLCWIPSKDYQNVVEDQNKRAELAKFYPRGIEIELSEEGLGDAGITLGIPPEQLQRAFLDLLETNLVPDTGMVELASLQHYLDEGKDRTRDELTAELAEKLPLFEELDEDDLLRKIVSAPPMTEGDEARQVYRRLDVEQRQFNKGKQGG